MTKLFSDYDGSPVEQASDLDYFTTDRCDGCDRTRYGKMMHAAGATGRCCAVLFLCADCRRDQQEEEDYEESYDDEIGDGMTDVEADANALASAGWGTDEDYGYFGD